MWYYSQGSGNLLKNSTMVAEGYSGHEEGRNNPRMQTVHEIGPIPQGTYTIEPPRKTKEQGPFVLPLTPLSALRTFGRTGFLIHGDDVKHDASRGCIILSRDAREEIWNSRDHQITVVV